MDISKGSVHIVCINGDTDPPTVESTTKPNEVLAARWLIVKACPRRKKACKEFCDFMREFLDELQGDN
jgi:hypothetical protein